MPNPEFPRQLYDVYGIRNEYRIVEGPTGPRNVGHVSAQDAYDLGLSPENNAGINYLLSSFGDPEIAIHYNPDFENGVPSAELLSRYLAAVVEFSANGLTKIISKDALSWQELPQTQIREIVDGLYASYARTEVTKQAFDVFTKEVNAYFGTSTESAVGYIVLNTTFSE